MTPTLLLGALISTPLAFDMANLLIHFALNAAITGFIIHRLYYPKSKRRDYYFTFMLIATSVFMLIHLMNGSTMAMGAALGLFAVFGIIRYRTESVPIREMTYLFFIVAISVVNAMTRSYALCLLADAIFLIAAIVCESNLLARRIACKYVRYDNIDLIVPERRQELTADLERRLGVKVTRVEIGAVDFLRDMTMMKVFYEDKDTVNSVNQTLTFPDENGTT